MTLHIWRVDSDRLTAGGTGLAPLLAMLEQQVDLLPARDMVLVWSTRNVADSYALEPLQSLAVRAPNLRILLAAEMLPGASAEMEHLPVIKGNVLTVLVQYDCCRDKGIFMPLARGSCCANWRGPMMNTGSARIGCPWIALASDDLDQEIL